MLKTDTEEKDLIVQKLETGYWHVRFNMNQFVQWPVGGWPRVSDTFGFFVEDQEDAANRAGLAVRNALSQSEAMRRMSSWLGLYWPCCGSWRRNEVIKEAEKGCL